MRLLTPDTSRITSFEERGKFIMAWRLSLLFLVVFIALAFAFRPISWESAMVYSAVVIIALSILIYLHRTQKSRIAYWIYAMSGSIIAQLTLNSILDSAHFGEFLWILSTIIFAFVGLGKIPGYIFTAAHIVGIGYYIAFSLNPHFEEVRVHDTGSKLALFLELLLGFISIGYMLNQFVVFQNYSRNQLKLLNKSLEEQNENVLLKNKENITLVKEVHHRVKNNLQIIISLLRIQRSDLKSEEAKKQFTVAINRILTMSLIHQKLYQEKEPSKINMREYLNDLTSELVNLSGEKVSWRVIMDADEEYTDLKTIVPFGLLINELVANSMKHAFKNEEQGTIRIQLKRSSEDASMRLLYSDNGEWCEPKESEGFGLELIEILTEQMDGTHSRNGSSYSFHIPLES